MCVPDRDKGSDPMHHACVSVCRCYLPLRLGLCSRTWKACAVCLSVHERQGETLSPKTLVTLLSLRLGSGCDLYLMCIGDHTLCVAMRRLPSRRQDHSWLCQRLVAYHRDVSAVSLIRLGQPKDDSFRSQVGESLWWFSVGRGWCRLSGCVCLSVRPSELVVLPT